MRAYRLNQPEVAPTAAQPDAIDLTKVEKTFVLDEGRDGEHARQLFTDVPYPVIEAVTSAVDQAERTLQRSLARRLPLAVIDHIQYVLERLQQGIRIPTTSRPDLRVLHPHEFAAAEAMAASISASLATALEPTRSCPGRPCGILDMTLWSTMSTPRIAFLDVDGTILDHGRAIAASTIEAIQGARAAGHLVYLSTGRAAGDIHPDVLDIGFDGAISNGGAHALSGDDVVVSSAMPVDAVEKLTAYLDEHGILYFLQTDAAVYASEQVQASFARLMLQVTRTRQGSTAAAANDQTAADSQTAADPQTAPQGSPRFRDIADLDRSQVAKAVFVSDRPGVVEQLQADMGDVFHVVPGSMPFPGGSNGEIGMRGTTKGSAILSVLEHLGIDREASIGIGDSWNDVEMFEVCGVGIAMGNAVPELHALADESTTSVREDGIFNAFRRHGLV